MMSETASPPPAKRRPWMGVLLLLSLMFNMLVIGAAASRMWDEHHFGFRHEPGGAGFLQPLPHSFIEDLTDARRHELFRALDPARRQFVQGQGNVRKLAGDLANALEAQPYDSARIGVVIDGFAAEGDALLKANADAAVAFIAALTPEERAQLAHRIRERSAARRMN